MKPLPILSYLSRWHCLRTGLLGAILMMLIGCQSSAPESELALSGTVAPQSADDFLIVDCLLPGQVRKLGGQLTYLTARRPIRTSAVNCEIRGGEYVAYDRADYSTALKIWLPKAQEGDAIAQNYVGEIYEKGLGIEPDYATAAHWYRQAAEQGNARAQINMGHLSEKGLGVKQDMQVALNWYRKASGLGGDELQFASTLKAEYAAQEQELTSLRSELAQHRQAEAQLHAEVQRTQQQLQSKQRALDEAEREMEQIRQQLESLKATPVGAASPPPASDPQLQQQIAALDRDKQQLQQQLQRANTELGSHQQELAATQRELDNTRMQLEQQRQLAASRSAQEQDKALLEQLEQRNRELERQQQRYEQAIAESRQQQQTLQRQLDDKERQVQVTEQRLQQSEAELASSRASYEQELQQFAEETQAQQQRREAEVAALQQQLEEGQQQRQQLQQERELLLSSQSGSEELLQQTQSQQQALQRQLDDKQQQLLAQQQQLQQREAELADLRKQYDQAQQQAGAQSQAEQRAREQEMAELEQQIAQSRQRGQQTEQELGRLQSQQTDLQLQLASSRQQQQELTRQLSDKERQLQQLNQSLEQSQSTLAARSARYESELQQFAEETQAQQRRRQAEIAALERELQTRQQLVNTQQSQITQLQQEVMQQERQLSELEAAETQELAQLEPPTIEIIEPPIILMRGVPSVRLQAPVNEREVIGKVVAPAGLLTFQVNGKSEPVSANSLFRIKIPVRSETTPVEIVAVDKQGRRVVASFSLISEHKADETAVKPADTGRGRMDLGNYYALVIGNNLYQHFPSLNTAKNDARETEQLLRERYGFKTTLLLDADRYQILSALNQLRQQLTEHDNLLIYYAGHGELDKVNDRGYWLPIDAEQGNNANWISNVDITDILNAMEAKQVMVVADSCYSGTLSLSSMPRLELSIPEQNRNEWIRALAQVKARTVLTSGGVQPVPDAGGGGHSIFAKAFLESLRSNSRILEGHALYREVLERVQLQAAKLNLDQVPEYAPIHHAGHEAGEFFFRPL